MSHVSSYLLISTVSLIQHTYIKKHTILSTILRAMEDIKVETYCPCPGGFYSLAGNGRLQK